MPPAIPHVARPPAPGTRAILARSGWAVIAAFGAYFCMYGFRKPYTAASFAEVSLWGLGFKTVLVTAQVLGYTLAKFIGIKVIAETRPRYRAASIIGLIAAAELSLLLFGLFPLPWNFIWLFGNGLALGMVFGLVLGFLEGRQQTEALTAGLCASFIVADGVTRSAGAYLLAAGVSETWMPFTAGLLFAGPLLLFVWMLSRIPPPTPEDIAARSERPPMTAADRRNFYHRYAIGLTLLVVVYLLCTVLRSMRSDFAKEIFTGLGTTGQPEIYAQTEMLVGLGVMLASGLAVFIHDNRRAFFTALGLALLGFLLVAAVLTAQRARLLSPLGFMTLFGVGLYLPYVVVHTTVFERLLALTRARGNLGYLMYIADSFGYLGYVAVMLGGNWLVRDRDFLEFFLQLSWWVVGASVLMLVPCWLYFAARTATHPPPTGEATTHGASGPLSRS